MESTFLLSEFASTIPAEFSERLNPPFRLTFPECVPKPFRCQNATRLDRLLNDRALRMFANDERSLVVGKSVDRFAVEGSG